MGEQRPAIASTLLGASSREYLLCAGEPVRLTQQWGPADEQCEGAAAWDGGHALAEYIDRDGDVFDSSEARWRGANAVELGAGAGGLCTIALLRNGARVLSTDGDERVLRILEANVRRNCDVEALGGFVGATKFRWGERVDRDVVAHMPTIDVVVASDVAYAGNKDTYVAFVDTLDYLCKRRDDEPGSTPKRHDGTCRRRRPLVLVRARRVRLAPVRAQSPPARRSHTRNGTPRTTSSSSTRVGRASTSARCPRRPSWASTAGRRRSWSSSGADRDALAAAGGASGSRSPTSSRKPTVRARRGGGSRRGW